jgi:hypothetical protein
MAKTRGNQPKQSKQLSPEEKVRLGFWAVLMLIGGLTSWICYNLTVGPPYNPSFILPWLLGIVIAFLGALELYFNAKTR